MFARPTDFDKASVCSRIRIAQTIHPRVHLTPSAQGACGSTETTPAAESGSLRRASRSKPCFFHKRSYVHAMELTQIEDYAIQAHVAALIGATVFDRIFAGVRFVETDGALLYVYSRDEGTAAEIEDDFSLLIADTASRILKREAELVVVLPKVLQ